VYRTPQGAKVAVRGLTFGVPAGQIFGFLGINGAGKTTTISMLTGDGLPTSGTARLAGYDVLTQQPQVRRLLGYCPQADALLELLTVREHLELYARIKGVPEPQVAAVVAAKLAQLDLGAFANKKAGSLSGGNKRKLSVACALIGDPPLVFLDEPSTGMDPLSRRFMWDVLARVATADRACSIILTTHSMEECEALCSRLGIMVGGRLRCLGSPAYLKAKFGQGYSLEVKLQAAAPPAVASVKRGVAAAVAGAVGAPSGRRETLVRRAALPALFAALGRPTRIEEVSEGGRGWSLHAAFARSDVPALDAPPAEKCISADEVALWWAEEDQADAMAAFVTDAFPGSRLVERQGSMLRFSLPSLPPSPPTSAGGAGASGAADPAAVAPSLAAGQPARRPLSAVFSTVEAAQAALNMAGFSLCDTSLEMVFNAFAAQQDEERGSVRGLPPAGVGGPTDQPVAGGQLSD
jgi:ATP-binding cassette subfamily A (ABC1) protein 1